MYKHILFVFFIGLGCSKNKPTECNYISDYFPHIYEAEINFLLGEYEQAYEYYSLAFESCKALRIGIFRDTDKYAKVCAILGYEDQSIQFIRKSIRAGGKLEQFRKDTAFYQIFKSTKGQEIIVDYERMRESFLNSLDLKLRDTLQQLIALDLMHNMTESQDSAFYENDKKLLSILKQFGYPNEKAIGPYNLDMQQSGPEILLLHSTDSIRINHFIPMLKKYVSNGQCSPYILGQVLDNYELFHQKPQTHGTFGGVTSRYANMIDDLKKVDFNRINIGLPSLEKQQLIDSLKQLKSNTPN